MKKQQKILSVSVTPQEYGEILIKSANEGLTVSSYGYKKLFSENTSQLEKGGNLGTHKELDNIKLELAKEKNKVISLEKEISALKSKKTPINSNLDKDKIKNILSRNPNLKIENYNLDTQAEKNPKLKHFCLECYDISKLING